MDELAMSVSEAVRRRGSKRDFLDRPVDGTLLRRLLAEAARSPSGGNLQPWHVYVLGGEELARFRQVVADRLATDPRGDGPGYDIYPTSLGEPYKGRRMRCGEDMYGTMGIGREDKSARQAFLAGNFRFWGAPVGLFFAIDRGMGPPQWSDLGMFIQTFMLLATGAGLDCCAQEAWTLLHKTVAAFVGMPPEEMLFCGLALGYADPVQPVNGLRTERAALAEFARFHGI